MIPRKTASGSKTQEFVDVIARAIAQRGEATKKEIGAEVRGIIYHCLKFKKGGHTLRAKAALNIEVPNGFFISIEDMVRVLENAFSSRMRTSPSEQDIKLASREMEAHPKSVEDIVRDVLHGAAKKFFQLPSDTMLTASCTAEESIAPYSTFAEKRTALGKIRQSTQRIRNKR